METTKQKLIRYAISFAYTFFSVAAITLTSDLLGVIDSGGMLDKTILVASISGAAVAGFRAVAKLLGELLNKLPTPAKLAGRLLKRNK